MKATTKREDKEEQKGRRMKERGGKERKIERIRLRKKNENIINPNGKKKR